MLLCPSDGMLMVPRDNPLARIRPFQELAREGRRGNFHNLQILTNSFRRYMAEILPIRRKTFIQSINV